MLVAKMLFNSVVSTKGAKFMTMDISNFYLMTPLKRPEYIRLKLSDVPEEVIVEYGLREKADKDGCIYIEANKGMYGLPQSGLLANELLEKRLNAAGYKQSKLVPGLWKHEWRPIQFTLVVDDFGVKYVGEEHALHLNENHQEGLQNDDGLDRPTIHRNHHRLGLRQTTGTSFNARLRRTSAETIPTRPATTKTTSAVSKRADQLRGQETIRHRRIFRTATRQKGQAVHTTGMWQISFSGTSS